LVPNRPVILTDMLTEWPATKNWSFSHFRAAFPERELRVRGGSRRTWRLLGRVRAADYLDFVTSDTPEKSPVELLSKNVAERPYAAFNQVGTKGEEIAFESLVPSEYEMTAAMFWIGPKGSLTPLHYDASGLSAFAQFVGRKRFVLYPFEDTEYLYPSDIFDYQSVFSSVNIDAPDLARYPKFPKARRIELVLEPGELLFIPNKMWHQVEALDNSISVSRRMTKTRLTPEAAAWNTKAFLHLLGLYKPERCLCHIDPLTPADLAVFGPAIRFLVKAGGLKAHGKDLAEQIGWV